MGCIIFKVRLISDNKFYNCNNTKILNNDLVEKGTHILRTVIVIVIQRKLQRTQLLIIILIHLLCHTLTVLNVIR